MSAIEEVVKMTLKQGGPLAGVVYKPECAPFVTNEQWDGEWIPVLLSAFPPPCQIFCSCASHFAFCCTRRTRTTVEVDAFVDPAGRPGIARVLVSAVVPVFMPPGHASSTNVQQLVTTQLRSATASGVLLELANQKR